MADRGDSGAAFVIALRDAYETDLDLDLSRGDEHRGSKPRFHRDRHLRGVLHLASLPVWFFARSDQAGFSALGGPCKHKH